MRAEQDDMEETMIPGPFSYYRPATVADAEPALDPLDPRSLARWAAAELDAEGHLLELIR